MNILNSKILQSSYSFSLSIEYFKFSSSILISKFVKIFASSLLKKAISFSFVRFFIREGPIPSIFFKSSMFSYIFSRLSYLENIARAFFSPIFVTPGIPSLLSPISPNKSGIFSGTTPK